MKHVLLLCGATGEMDVMPTTPIWCRRWSSTIRVEEELHGRVVEEELRLRVMEGSAPGMCLTPSPASVGLRLDHICKRWWQYAFKWNRWIFTNEQINSVCEAEHALPWSCSSPVTLFFWLVNYSLWAVGADAITWCIAMYSSTNYSPLGSRRVGRPSFPPPLRLLVVHALWTAAPGGTCDEDRMRRERT